MYFIRVKYRCPTCNGRGKNPKRPRGCIPHKINRCYDCHGTGSQTKLRLPTIDEQNVATVIKQLLSKGAV